MVSGIPATIKKQIDSLPFYKVCAKAHLKDHTCSGKITLEHAVEFAGKRLNELWAIIPLCEYGHSVNTHLDGGDLNKEINLWIALSRASGGDLIAVSKAVNYTRELDRLTKKYGVYNEAEAVAAYMALYPSIPGNTPVVKKNWYLVEPEVKKLIDESRDFFRGFGLEYSQKEIIDLAILEYCETTKKQDATS
jgi:hypothetical protein